MADTSCQNDWKTTSTQLEKGQLQLNIPDNPQVDTYVPPASICSHFQTEAGHQWLYVTGTYAQTADLVVPNNGPAVFGFQQAESNGPWTWEDVFLNLPNCSAP
jgi:hypothetical protein